MRKTQTRNRYVLGAVAAGVLVILIVALLPWSGSNVASSLWTAIGGGGHYTLEQVNAHLAQGKGGFVDRMSPADGQVIVEGWAEDAIAKQPAVSVQIFVNGANAGGVASAVERPDVSKELGVSTSLFFGFKASVAAKASDAIKAFAEQRNGSFVELHYPQLAPRKYGTGARPVYTIEQVSAHLAQRAAGFVDKMHSTNGTVVLEGWAEDVVTKLPALSVQIFVNDANAGDVAFAVERPDVSKDLGVTASPLFGFTASVAAKASDEIRAFAEQTDGSFAELHYPRTAP
jgi:hypothetical protein